MFSIPFSNRFLIDFRSLGTLNMVISYRRGAIFHKIAVSEKLSKNDQFLIQKTFKNQSKIDQKRYQKSYQNLHPFLIDFSSKKTSQNGAQDGMSPVRRRALPEPLRSPMYFLSRKSKPPNLNFIKKVTPKPKQSSNNT